MGIQECTYSTINDEWRHSDRRCNQWGQQSTSFLNVSTTKLLIFGTQMLHIAIVIRTFKWREIWTWIGALSSESIGIWNVKISNVGALVIVSLSIVFAVGIPKISHCSRRHLESFYRMIAHRFRWYLRRESLRHCRSEVSSSRWTPWSHRARFTADAASEYDRIQLLPVH